RPARDERDGVTRARAYNRLHLLGRLRQHDERRHDAVARQPVALVRPQLLGRGNHRAGPQSGSNLVLERARQRHECKATSVATKTDITLTLAVPAGGEAVLADEALDFAAALHREFNPRRLELLARRSARQRELAAGALPDFLEETRHIREDESWRVAPAPRDLWNRRVEITGPVERKMMINALNSGAQVFMADFEDASSPTWENCVLGQQNLIDAIDRTISLETPGKSYRLGESPATLLVRPRGWHLPEKH